MYLEYFGFTEEPFTITPNTRFLFPSRRHREASAALQYGIEQRKGFIVLTGEIGCGKTTLCRALLGRMDREKTRIALILNPQLNDLELLQAINTEYGIDAASQSKRELLDILNRFLLEQYTRGNNCVLMIDESQRLSPDALEQVRLIGNLETETTKLIQIVLVGQPELDDMLHLPELEQLNQRIMVRYHIEPLDEEEVAEYVQHRLDIAAPKRTVSFDPKALRRIHAHTGGVPRRVNVLCDRALLLTYVRESSLVTEEIVADAIKEVDGQRRRKPTAPKPQKPTRASKAATPPAKLDTDFDAPEGDSEAPEPATGTAEPGVPATTPPGASRGAMILVTAAILAAGGYYFIQAKGTPRGVDTPPLRTNPPAAETPTPIAAVPAAATTPAATPESTPEAIATIAATTATPALSILAAGRTPGPTQTPIATPGATATPPPTATSTPTPAPPDPFVYDADGIMRHPTADLSYAASVLTWLSRAQQVTLSDAELAQLRAMSTAEVAAYRLASGAPPLYLREAELPPLDSSLDPSLGPLLVQVDARAQGFGPWCVLLERRAGNGTLLDARNGRVEVPLATLEEHLAGVVAPYRDEPGITGLRPLDAGEAVKALQRRLVDAGFLGGAISGNFDGATERAVLKAREVYGLPGGAAVDPALALRILRIPEKPAP